MMLKALSLALALSLASTAALATHPEPPSPPQPPAPPAPQPSAAPQPSTPGCFGEDFSCAYQDITVVVPGKGRTGCWKHDYRLNLYGVYGDGCEER